MKKYREIFNILFVLATILSASQVWAAERYIRDGGSSDFSSCGSNWLNACDRLPDSLVRGDTYYIADGAYGGHTFRDAESGSQWIIIKKAIEEDHGTNVGWQSAYGNGQAVFNGQLKIIRGYYEFDGQRRNENNWQDHSQYGFVVRPSNGANSHGFNIYDNSGNNWEANHLRFSYIDIGGSPGSSYPNVPDRAFSIVYNDDNIYIGYCHMHHLTIPIAAEGADYITLEKSHIGPSWGKEAIRGGGSTDHWVVRHNRFVNNGISGSESLTADIGVFRERNEVTLDWQIYGNLFLNNTASNINHNNGIIYGGKSGSGYVNSVRDWKIYNNVFSGIQGRVAAIKLKASVNSHAYNNIWHNIVDTSQTNSCSATSCENNWCYNSGGSSVMCDDMHAAWPTTIRGADDPFVDWRNGDFRLKDPSGVSGVSPVNSGKTLGSGFDPIDALDQVRGADGAWDVGLFEFDGYEDNSAPELLSAQATSANSVTVTFTEALDPGSVSAGDFVLTNGVSVNAVTVSSDGLSTTLTTTSLVDGVSYTLSVSGVSDVFGNLIIPGSNVSFIFTTPNVITGLVAYWPFEEGAGNTTADSSGNENDGVLNSTAWASGQSGGGLDFNGSTSFIDLGGMDVSGNALTISAWINARDLSVCGVARDCRVLSKASGTASDEHYWMLGTVSNGSETRVRFRLKTGSTTLTHIATSGDISLNSWVHIAAVYDGAQVTLYQNNVIVGTFPQSGAVATNSSVQANIGRNPNGSDYFDGKIDEVRIYNRGLDSAELEELFNDSSGGDIIAPAGPEKLQIN